jgi:NAD(P)-dependent dehydrogenase (short-subunit alcohol dehydrogenase family)
MTDYKAVFSLKGKTAVVSGGVGLLGTEVVTALAQAGARVVIADIDDVKGQKLVSALARKKMSAAYQPFDITDINALAANVQSVVKKFKYIDVWVNMAYPRTRDWGNRVEDVAGASFARNIEMHLVSYAMVTKYAAEAMKKRGGSIINFGSIYGSVGPDFSVYDGTAMTMPFPYAVIKAGINNLGRYMASYFGEYGVRVNTIAPGGVLDKQNPSFVKNYSKKAPLKRMALPREIPPAVVFLASEASSYVTGTVLMVDGGWTAV